MERSFLDYAMSVITARALPDARDGLKPCTAGSSTACTTAGCAPTASTRSRAPSVGDVMGKFHPHGDSAIYDALARMAQDFSLRYPLDRRPRELRLARPERPAWRPRATPRRGSRRWRCSCSARSTRTPSTSSPTYDGNTDEPVVLPARFPNLLVNGGGGIAVGMATNIPPHNLGEVIDAARAPARQPRRDRRRPHAVRAGPRLPDRRADPRAQRDPRRLHDRPRLHQDARGRRDRGGPQGRARASSSPRCRTRRRSR